MLNPFKNISLNMKATGPATVISVWILSVTLLGLFGQGELARSAMTFLGFAGGMILAAMAFKVNH